jgi:PAS domain S-box-containing protein
MDIDRDLLLGVLALRAELIDSQQLIEACTTWVSRKDTPLTALLVERGWILPADREHLESLLTRKLQRVGNASLVTFAGLSDDIRRSLAALEDPDLNRSLATVAYESEDVHPAEPGGCAGQNDRYQLTRLHACGGIGRVWLAHDRAIGREIALKELRPEHAHDGVLRARFLREAKITGQLEHPGIAPVYELARRPDTLQPFYAMRFVKGRTLSEVCREYHVGRAAGQADSLQFLTMLNALVIVCNTIAYAHSRGVIHRDLKGQNVVLGNFGEVVVLDWGLAKVIGAGEEERLDMAVHLDHQEPGDSELTVAGQTLGTPAYMAPEQAAGSLDQINVQTDVYGLGAILYEILTGRPPFCGSDTRDVLRKVQEEAPIPPRDVWSDVPSALEAVCLRALSKRPADRYTSASEVASQVQGWQEMQRRQAEEALRQSEALYHSLVEMLPLQVWRKDLESRFTFVNKGFCDATGRTPDDLIGRTDLDLFPAELAEKYREDDRGVLRSGKTFEDIEEHVTTKGERLFVRVVKRPIYDGQGQIVGTQGIFWDVTDRRRLQEALDRVTAELAATKEQLARLENLCARSQVTRSEDILPGSARG